MFHIKKEQLVEYLMLLMRVNEEQKREEVPEGKRGLTVCLFNCTVHAFLCAN